MDATMTNLDALIKHYDRVIADLEKLFLEKEKLYLEKFDTVYTIMAHEKEAIEEARKLALEAQTKHFESLNNSAKTLDDFKNNHVLVVVYQLKIEELEDKMRNQTILIDNIIKDEKRLLEEEAEIKRNRELREGRIIVWLFGLSGSVIIFVLNYIFAK